MEQNRPDFKDIKSFEEFNKYYWYREELSQICKSLTLEYRGTKQELNYIIEQYFKGNRIERMSEHKNKKHTEVITLNTPLLECNFSFNQKFRDYFSVLTGVKSFKFTANMATAWRKVKGENDIEFTIQDMINIYYGELDYAKYDNSVCQWNQFLKDFCRDENNKIYYNKLKAASILWKVIRDQPGKKVYSASLLKKHQALLRQYKGENK